MMHSNSITYQRPSERSVRTNEASAGVGHSEDSRCTQSQRLSGGGEPQRLCGVGGALNPGSGAAVSPSFMLRCSCRRLLTAAAVSRCYGRAAAERFSAQVAMGSLDRTIDLRSLHRGLYSMMVLCVTLHMGVYEGSVVGQCIVHCMPCVAVQRDCVCPARLYTCVAWPHAR